MIAARRSRRPLVSAAAAGAHPKVQHHAQQIIVLHVCDLSAADAEGGVSSCNSAPEKPLRCLLGRSKCVTLVCKAVGQGCASLVSYDALPVAMPAPRFAAAMALALVRWLCRYGDAGLYC